MHVCKPILGKQKQTSHDCFRTAVTIPLLGLDTLPPRAGQNWFCWSGKGSPTSGFHIGQAQLPLDHDSEVPSPSFKAQKPEEHGLCCDPRETEATIQQPWSVPRSSPDRVPLTATQTHSRNQSRATLTASSPWSCSSGRGGRPLRFAISPKTQGKEINYFGLKDFQCLKKADLLNKNLMSCFYFLE